MSGTLSSYIHTLVMGPSLSAVSPNVLYSANLLETFGNALLTVAAVGRNIVQVTSPLLVPYLLYRYPHPDYYMGAAKFIVIFYAAAFLLRTFGRASNHEYRIFTSVLASAKQNYDQEEKRRAINRLKLYDYQQFAAPIDYEVSQPHPQRWFLPPSADDAMQPLNAPMNFLREVISYVCVHTFGLRMLYPGSLAILKSMLHSTFVRNRSAFLSVPGTSRNLLLTKDGNRIDSMFWDRRGHSDGRGETLVVCCEGNAGYYEAPGVVVAPMKLNYSVLGWNMPGFAESSGKPYPDQVVNAMDAVMRFATERLGFRPENIVLYAWSIGGFPATWAAANYHNVRALILDATFDDVLPLAMHRMPSAIERIVHYTIRRHMNLDIARQLAQYHGPLQLIRRWDDEMITTPDITASDEERRASNRANFLLIDVIRRRYPGLLLTDEDQNCIVEWLALDPEERIERFDPGEPIIPRDLERLDTERRKRLIRDVCAKLMVDFLSTHNAPLNQLYFNIPTPIQMETL